ncbi:MAG TPA: 3-carboxy-cis,cis-muconate cycloisomerase [Xanthobacteraceae bacterium]|nr:3-carboxy-cis,cis-muconate cycloisomerase [Xanthobacteraceae bacterium]
MTASDLFGPLFATNEMRSLFSERATLARMLKVEAALAEVEAAVGVIPRGAAGPIAAACNPDRYDIAELGLAAPASGNVAIPLVKALTAEVARRDKEAARFVHWGATSQDIIDSATSLAIRDGAALIGRDLDRAIKAFAALARRYRKKPMAGRTWLQQALPITFGLKAARYAAMLARVRAQLHEAANNASVLQFGGAAGTLASLGSKGSTVSKKLAASLDLDLPDLPWHGERDRVAVVATTLGIVIGASGKIARDVSLMMQTEVAEAFEPAAPGKGGSSTMPHKRNPVACAQILTAATLAPGLVASALSGMVQEHERALGGWQAEWIALPQLFLLTSGAVAQLAEMAKGLEVDAERMRANLEFTNGLVMAEAIQMALGEKLGRMEAHDLLETASRKAVAEGRHLREIVTDIPQIADTLGEKKLDALFDPLAYLGGADDFIDRALQAAEQPVAKSAKRKGKKR